MRLAEFWRKSIAEKGMCKGPEAQACLVAKRAAAERVRKGLGGGRVQRRDGRWWSDHRGPCGPLERT